MTVDEQDPDRVAQFEATITAEPYVFAECDDLELDILPDRTRLDDGRAAVKAVLRLDQLVYLVSAGATVLLERVIPPFFPPEQIASPEGARARLEGLRQFRGARGD
jgi:hypothetical protein